MFGWVQVDYDVSFVFPGATYFCSWNKTFKFDDNLLRSLTVLFDFWSASVNSILFWLFFVNIQTVLDITFDNRLTLFFTLDSFNLRDSRRPYCSRSSIFLDFKSHWDSKYTSFPSKLVILSFNFSMDASLAFSFPSNVDFFFRKIFYQSNLLFNKAFKRINISFC